MVIAAALQKVYHPQDTLDDYEIFIQEQGPLSGIDLMVCPPSSSMYFSSFEEYLTYHRSLAKRYKCMLAPGIFCKDNYNTALLISHGGDIIHHQHQTHLSRREFIEGLKRGSELEVADTPVGKIGFMIYSDCFYPQVGRILGLQGADLIIAFYRQPAPYNKWLQLSGVWQQVQHNQFFAVEAGFNGVISSQEYEAETIIHHPLWEKGDNGCLKKIEIKQKGIIQAKLDSEKRKEIKETFPIYKYLNRTLYQKEWGKHENS